ncbi:type IV pilus assembly protein PilV [Chromohalobacter marismortui]|uniref:Type IV pilus assembly protein PilV n=1 Tax=Chromohalobacter marismortui TaxID=42055 RepID=A0A4R7NF50_9GAMM|nr:MULTISPECIES: prepilin-type N-terminal cleavage/methylation domain-containing protein [Chromohalobacter]MCI0511118.1 prepilin-type N-terminal cleavage/methylation domain-containing protein [Chromohalobacter sp.]MCI0593222.1 prepilin-type N-terminal cleavage/methylation domain-containing protein [Chromohalobacter sp.]TDU19145.1 type IV pilus assembly protein PilV [Chromohalobacter marismortui]
MMVTHRNTRWRHGRVLGFSLIEVLITLFILSFGMLGLAAIQAQVLRAQRHADAESQAVQRVVAMLERLRIDRHGALVGTYDQPCSDDPSSAASAQVRAWLTGLVNALPQAQGCIEVVGNDDVATATVKVMWQSPRARWSDDDGRRQYRLQTRL